MQFVVETTRIADWSTPSISPPETGVLGATVCAEGGGQPGQGERGQVTSTSSLVTQDAGVLEDYL